MSIKNGNVYDEKEHSIAHTGRQENCNNVRVEPLSSWTAQELMIMLRHVRRCGPRRLRELCTELAGSGRGVRTPADVCAAIRELQARADRELRRRAARQPKTVSASSGGAARREVPRDPLALWARKLRAAPGAGGPALRMLAALEHSARGFGLRAAYLCVGAALEARPAPPPSARTALLVRAALVQVAHRAARIAPRFRPSRRLTAATSHPTSRNTDHRSSHAPRSEQSVLSSLLMQPDFNPLQLSVEDCCCEK